jgi:long-chain acyl-CoA synthetase
VADTIASRLIEQARRRPGSPALYSKVDGEYRAITWADYAEEVRRAGKALIAQGLEPGQHVAILGFNRAEWVILDVACISGRWSPRRDLHHFVTRGGRVHRGSLRGAPDPRREQGPAREGARGTWQPAEVAWIVTMRGPRRVDRAGVMTWDAFLASWESGPTTSSMSGSRPWKPDDLATLIYTSGTTGSPKA